MIVITFAIAVFAFSRYEMQVSHKGCSCMKEILGLFYVMFDRKRLDAAQHHD